MDQLHLMAENAEWRSEEIRSLQDYFSMLLLRDLEDADACGLRERREQLADLWAREIVLLPDGLAALHELGASHFALVGLVRVVLGTVTEDEAELVAGFLSVRPGFLPVVEKWAAWEMVPSRRATLERVADWAREKVARSGGEVVLATLSSN